MFSLLVTLRASCGAVYCNRSSLSLSLSLSLSVCVCVCLCVDGWVCYQLPR